MYRRNVAPWDRLLRLSLCAAMLGLAVLGDLTPPWSLAVIVFALYPFVTGALGWDPVYVLMGYRGTRRPADR